MSKIRKILILAENLDIQITSSSKCISKIAVALSSSYQVTVLYPSIYKSQFKWLPNIEMVPLEAIERKNQKGYSFLDKLNSRITGFSFQEHKIIRSWQKGIKNLLDEQEFHAIMPLASGVDFYTHHSIALMQINVPILSYYHDPYPWMYYPDTYRMTKARIIQRLKTKSLEKVLNRSVANLFPSKNLAVLYMYHYHFNKDSILITPHLNVTLNNIYDWESGEDYPISIDDFNITYAGALHSSRKVETLLLAFEKFRNTLEGESNVFLNFLGPLGAYSSYIDDQSKKMDGSLRTFGRVSYDRSLVAIKNSQVNVIIEADDSSSPFLPGKFPDYIMAQRPILHIGPADCEVLRLMGSDYPYAVRHGQIEELTILFNQLFLQFKSMGALRMVRSDLEEYLSPEVFVDAINSILESDEK